MPAHYLTPAGRRARAADLAHADRCEQIAGRLSALYAIAEDICLLADRGADDLRDAADNDPETYDPLIAEAHALFARIWRHAGAPDGRARALITTDPLAAPQGDA